MSTEPYASGGADNRIEQPHGEEYIKKLEVEVAHLERSNNQKERQLDLFKQNV